MNVTAWFKSETWSLPPQVWGLVVATSVAATLLCVGTAASATAIGLIVMAPLLLLLATGGRLSLQSPGVATIAALCCWAYACLSVLWAADIGFAARALLVSAAMVAAIHISRPVHDAVPDAWLEHMTRTVLVVFVLFAIYGFIEEMLDHPIKRHVFWPFQAFRLVDGWPSWDLDHVSRVRPTRTNWNMAAMSLMLWPVLLFLRAHVSEAERRWMVPALIALTLAMVLFSNHQTSMVALLFGLVIFLIAHVSIKAAALIAAASWCVAVMFVVPVSQLAYERQLHLEPAVPFTLQHRFVIWGYTAEQITKRPLFGVGVGSTQPIDDARPDAEKYREVDGTIFHWRTGSHPHNIFIQVIYEFGAVGGVLFMALGLAIAWAAARLPNPDAAHNLAAFATAAVMSSSTFGLFELWYVSVLAVVPVLLSMATAYAGRRRLNSE